MTLRGSDPRCVESHQASAARRDRLAIGPQVANLPHCHFHRYWRAAGPWGSLTVAVLLEPCVSKQSCANNYVVMFNGRDDPIGNVSPSARACGRVGHDCRGRRGYRVRGRDRRRQPRIRRPAAGTERFRQRDFQPQHEAGARGRALPGAGQPVTGDGSAERARAAATERSAPGAQSRLRGAQLRLVGSAVLWRGAEALQSAGR